MAVYDIDNLPAKFAVGDIINCPYKGAERSITLPKGTYKLECWGAHGAWRKEAKSYGGYSVGEYLINDEDTLVLHSGGNGTLTATKGSAKGWDDGGDIKSNTASVYGGGGSTHITSSKHSSKLMVAGGSGGSAATSRKDYTGGAGGGLTGGDGEGDKDSYQGKGGTQSAGGSAGSGSGFSGTAGSAFMGGNGDSPSTQYGGAGGGGYYGGGGSGATWYLGSGYYGGAGGGGSGYINTSLLTNAHTYRQDETGYKTNLDTTNYAGYISITILELPTILKLTATYNGTTIINKTIEDESASATYNGSTIATLTAGTTKTLKCKSKKARSDISFGGVSIKCNGKLFKTDIVLKAEAQ